MYTLITTVPLSVPKIDARYFREVDPFVLSSATGRCHSPCHPSSQGSLITPLWDYPSIDTENELMLLAEDVTQASQSSHHTGHFVLIFLFQEDFLKGSFRFIRAKWEWSIVLKTSETTCSSHDNNLHTIQRDMPWWILMTLFPLQSLRMGEHIPGEITYPWLVQWRASIWSSKAQDWPVI